MTVSTAVNPVTSISAAFNMILTFLEKISEENVWKTVFGERVVNLLQKYFGNDVVALSLAFYIAPILKTYWSKFSENLFKSVAPPGTVAVKIYATDNLYDIVSKYAYEHGSTRENLTIGIAQYADVYNANSVDEYDEDWYGDEWYDSATSSIDSEDAPVRVQLRPPSTFDEELTYKGHKIRIEFKEYSATESQSEPQHIQVSMLARDTRLLHVILQEWSDAYNKTQTVKNVYKASGSCWRYERSVPDRDLDSVHLRDGQKDHLIKDMQTFKMRADWYTKRGIPHRRGYLLYGPPGTGKTSMIQAVANHLKYDIAILGSIAGTNNEMLSSLMSSLPPNCILLIEDIDHLFESSGNSEITGKVTMSGLLNIMDGLQSQDGCMVFMTCNNINKITPALLRPGRIDVKLNFDYAMPEQVRDTFWRFMGLDEETSAPLSEEERAIAETHVEKFEKMIPASTVTTAEVQGYFIDILLEANAESWTRDRIYEAMFERIPEFLEKVERDRKQAEEHRQASKKASAEKASADKKEETEKEEEKSNELEW